MATLTREQAQAYTNKSYVILRTNIGEFNQGEVVHGDRFRNRHDPDPDAAAVNLQRLLWGKHVREALPDEVPLGKVTLETSDDEQVASFQHRISRLEAELNSAHKQLVEANGIIQRLQSERLPRPPSNNEQASLALLKAKEDRLNQMQLDLAQAQDQIRRLSADNEMLLNRITDPSTSSSAAEPPQAAMPPHPLQQASGRKPR